jgi:hypothetical protein
MPEHLEALFHLDDRVMAKRRNFLRKEGKTAARVKNFSQAFQVSNNEPLLGKW